MPKKVERAVNCVRLLWIGDHCNSDQFWALSNLLVLQVNGLERLFCENVRIRCSEFELNSQAVDPREQSIN
ncbi:unnamed protein product [Calypogeia fissa]